MNWKTLFFITLVLWLGTLAYCFYELSASKHHKPLCPPNTICDSLQVVEPALATAKEQIMAYKNLLDMVDVNPGNAADSITITGKKIAVNTLATEMNLLRGFKLPKCELEQIIKRNGEVPNVYTMLAINPNASGRKNQPIKYLDQYFIIMSKDETFAIKGLTNIIEDDFDFELPCPNSCPF